MPTSANNYLVSLCQSSLRCLSTRERSRLTIAGRAPRIPHNSSPLGPDQVLREKGQLPKGLGLLGAEPSRRACWLLLLLEPFPLLKAHLTFLHHRNSHPLLYPGNSSLTVYQFTCGLVTSVLPHTHTHSGPASLSSDVALVPVPPSDTALGQSEQVGTVTNVGGAITSSALQQALTSAMNTAVPQGQVVSAGNQLFCLPTGTTTQKIGTV